jgi:hypothetical protein
MVGPVKLGWGVRGSSASACSKEHTGVMIAHTPWGMLPSHVT